MPGIKVGSSEMYYYEKIINIIELEYASLPIKRAVLFKYEWYDPTPRGTKIHDKYSIMEIRSSRKYRKYDSVIFSKQAEQVYYASYPDTFHDKYD